MSNVLKASQDAMPTIDVNLAPRMPINLAQ